MSLFNIFKEESLESKQKKILKNFLSTIFKEHGRRDDEQGLNNTLGAYYYHHDLTSYHQNHWQSSLDALKSNNAQSYMEKVDNDTQMHLLSCIESTMGFYKFHELKLDKLKIQQWKNDFLEEVKVTGPVKEYTSSDYYTHGRKYSVYKIDYNDFFEKVCSDEQKQIYQEVKDSLSPRTKFKP